MLLLRAMLDAHSNPIRPRDQVLLEGFLLDLSEKNPPAELMGNTWSILTCPALAVAGFGQSLPLFQSFKGAIHRCKSPSTARKTAKLMANSNGVEAARGDHQIDHGT